MSAESLGVRLAREALDRAIKHAEYDRAALVEADNRAKESEQDVFRRDLALARAIHISVVCPICDAKVDEPCHGTQPANHTARSVAVRTNTKEET